MFVKVNLSWHKMRRRREKIGFIRRKCAAGAQIYNFRYEFSEIYRYETLINSVTKKIIRALELFNSINYNLIRALELINSTNQDLVRA